MDNIPIPPTPDIGEGGLSYTGDQVVISRSELDALLDRVRRTESVLGVDEEQSTAEPHSLRVRDKEPGGSDASREIPDGPSNPGRLTHHGIREAQFVRDAAARDERVAELERACKSAVRDRELATVLAGRSLVSCAPAQLIKLWREEFEAYEEDGSYKVAARDGRSVGQAVNDWLASPEYSHFCLPTSRGGTGARDANRPHNASNPTPAAKNLGEAIVMKWREESATRPSNFLKPIGLRRHR
jgi:hypothetical protein